jgi:hypothetical protein
MQGLFEISEILTVQLAAAYLLLTKLGVGLLDSTFQMWAKM